MSHFRAAAANARPTITVDGAGAGVVSHPGTYPPVDVDLADQQALFGGPVASDSPSLQLIDVIDKAGGSPKQARRSTTGLDPATAVNPSRVLRPHGIGSAGPGPPEGVAAHTESMRQTQGSRERPWVSN
jgi:hypothetical protein